MATAILTQPIQLIELAKRDSNVAATLREGSVSELLALLHNEGLDTSMEALQLLYRDLEHLNVRERRGRFWTW